MDWDADPSREAYQRAVQDYIEFAKIVHAYDEMAFPEHDDIDYVPLTLDELDGVEFPEQHVAVGRIALLFWVQSTDDEDLEDPEDWAVFDDYDDPKRCTRRRRKDEDDAGS